MQATIENAVIQAGSHAERTLVSAADRSCVSAIAVEGGESLEDAIPLRPSNMRNLSPRHGSPYDCYAADSVCVEGRLSPKTFDASKKLWVLQTTTLLRVHVRERKLRNCETF